MVFKAKDNSLDILIVFNSLMGGFGGASRHMLEVTKYWSSCKVDILISEYGYESMERHFTESSGNIKLYSTPFDKAKNRLIVYTSRIIKSLFLRKNMGEEYDVIIAPNYLPQNLIPAILFKKNKSKLVVYFHTVQPALRISYLNNMAVPHKIISLLNWELCLFLAKLSFDLVFVVNEPTKQYFIERGFSPKKVLVVDNAIPFKEIIEYQSNDKKYDGIFLSRLVKRKGVWDLIPIWKNVVSLLPSAKLCIIGSGPEMDKLKLKVDEEGLSKNVTFAGEVSDECKYKLLNQSKVFIFPSYYESWGIVIAEAIAAGLHVVTYDMPIYNKIFEKNIHKVEMGDIEGMKTSVIEILTNFHHYNQSLEYSKKFISKYDWEIIANQELSSIRKLL